MHLTELRRVTQIMGARDGPLVGLREARDEMRWGDRKHVLLCGEPALKRSIRENPQTFQSLHTSRVLRPRRVCSTQLLPLPSISDSILGVSPLHLLFFSPVKASRHGVSTRSPRVDIVSRCSYAFFDASNFTVGSYATSWSAMLACVVLTMITMQTRSGPLWTSLPTSVT